MDLTAGGAVGVREETAGAVNAVAAGSVDHDDALYVGPGSNGEHMVPLVTVTPGTHIRVSAKRTGAAVNGLFRAYLYRVAV